jgi:hypothetical protein
VSIAAILLGGTNEVETTVDKNAFEADVHAGFGNKGAATDAGFGKQRTIEEKQ